MWWGWRCVDVPGVNEAHYPGMATSVAGGLTPPPLPPAPRASAGPMMTPDVARERGFAPPPPPQDQGISSGAKWAIVGVITAVVLSIAASGVMITRAIGSVSTVSNLSPGECIEDFITTEEVFFVTTADCDQPHALDVYANRPDFWGSEERPHPGMNVLFAEGEAWCADQFEAFVGEPYETSPLGMWTFVPIVEGWAEGDRSVQCIVGSWDEQTLTTGTLRNSAGRESA